MPRLLCSRESVLPASGWVNLAIPLYSIFSAAHFEIRSERALYVLTSSGMCVRFNNVTNLLWHTMYEGRKGGSPDCILQCVLAIYLGVYVQPAGFASPLSIITRNPQIRMMTDKHDEDNLIGEKAAVNHGGNKDPMERILAMKDEQIRELKNNLVEVRGQLQNRDDEV